MVSPLDAKAKELAKTLDHLVSLNEPRHGGPYGGLAAAKCVEAMAASSALITAQAERIADLRAQVEKATDPAYLESALTKLNVCDVARAEAAEAEVRTLREALEKAREHLILRPRGFDMPVIANIESALRAKEP